VARTPHFWLGPRANQEKPLRGNYQLKKAAMSRLSWLEGTVMLSLESQLPGFSSSNVSPHRPFCHPHTLLQR
jgi:hypothetical protein